VTSSTVRHYSASGVDLGEFASGLFAPSWITADRIGNIYVSEYDGQRISKFSPAGVNLLTITTLYIPGGVQVGTGGNLYVASFNNNIIEKYSASGADLGTIASGDPTGSFLGIALDASGNLYVADYAGGHIHRFSPTGADLGVFASTGLISPRDLVIVPLGTAPAVKDDCKDDGWQSFNSLKNQADCIQLLNTGK
jgi:sugar lactone lactonase YvrE